MEIPETPVHPPAPPELDKKRLWWSILLPPGLSAVVAFLFYLGDTKSLDEAFLTLLMFVWGAAVLGSWVLFAGTIRARYRGRSAVLMIIAYPIAQIPICLAVFFGACLGSYSLGGKSFH